MGGSEGGGGSEGEPSSGRGGPRARGPYHIPGKVSLEIQELIGERPGPCWNKFMKGKHKDQSWAYSNDAYRKAAFFFYKEKRLGAQGKLAHMIKKTAKNVKAVLPDLSDVPTDGKTYLTPADCRKSLLTTLKKYQLTQGKLAKMIGENPVMVERFMADGGEFGGSDKGCYHPLAHFCEKLRIATGAKKSPKRLAIEAEGRERPYLGADPTKRYVVMAGDSLYRAREKLPWQPRPPTQATGPVTTHPPTQARDCHYTHCP